jgi:GNAT superfamily N-acetyltransferase
MLDQVDGLTCLDALAHATRLSVVRALTGAPEEGLTAGALAQALGVPGPTLTFHLAPLVAADIVQVTVQGRTRIHTLNRARLGELARFLDGLAGTPVVAGDPEPAALAPPLSATGAELSGEVPSDGQPRRHSLRLFSPKERPRLTELLLDAAMSTDLPQDEEYKYFAWGAAPAVAYAVLVTGPRVAVIRSVVVVTEARGQGHGTALVQALIAYARDRGLSDVWALAEGEGRFLWRLNFRAAERDAAVPGSVAHLARRMGVDAPRVMRLTEG